jgi:hypothetical protein
MQRKRITALRAMVSAIAIVSTLFLPILNEAASAQAAPVLTHPIPIEHYYWHFLVHQNQLDHSAAAMQAAGKSSDWMRNHLQRGLGFSDADYAAVRISSTRLAGELAVLNQQAAALSAAHVGSLGSSQFRLLSNQRTADINAEVAFLRQNLPPERIAALESYMVQFFTHSTKGVQ